MKASVVTSMKNSEIYAAKNISPYFSTSYDEIKDACAKLQQKELEDILLEFANQVRKDTAREILTNLLKHPDFDNRYGNDILIKFAKSYGVSINFSQGGTNETNI